MICQLKFAVNQLNVSSKFTKNGQQKCATCFATLLQNEFHSDVARFTALVLSLSGNKSGCWWCVNTDFWLNKITGKTRNMYRFWCNKWNYALISATTFRNLQQPDLLQDRFDSRVVKRATSLFSPYSSNVAKQDARFCFPFYPIIVSYKKTLKKARDLNR